MMPDRRNAVYEKQCNMAEDIVKELEEIMKDRTRLLTELVLEGKYIKKTPSGGIRIVIGGQL